jgi:hypothetical protein
MYTFLLQSDAKNSNNWLIKEDINPVLSRNELIQLDKVNPISRLSNADGESRPEKGGGMF